MCHTVVAGQQADSERAEKTENRAPCSYVPLRIVDGQIPVHCIAVGAGFTWYLRHGITAAFRISCMEA